MYIFVSACKTIIALASGAIACVHSRKKTNSFCKTFGKPSLTHISCKVSSSLFSTRCAYRSAAINVEFQCV